MKNNSTQMRYEKIMKNIISENEDGVCLEMVSIGMYDDFNDDVLSLVEACIKCKNEWIRKAGFFCLYHQYVNKQDDVCNDQFITSILIGISDSSNIVQNVVSEITSEVKEFSPKVYLRLTEQSKGKSSF
jgi:hypothetical protein